MILFIRSILRDLGIPQQAATILYKDNDACTTMANMQKPTSRTRHMDIQYFAHSEWVERELIILERIHTSINIAGHVTKVLDRTLLFYRHVDYIMGHIPPKYLPCYPGKMLPTGSGKQPTITLAELSLSPEAAAASRCSVRDYLWLQVIGY
eukprot:CCRYP_016353-RB/>CCRYP_016353-RB protein AED:0.55 eAED:0.55 QI:0/-1/0/1/-1/0/1/0/150